MYRINKNTGITLITLIITVIIMLILAGISISVITGDGGLFKKTSSSTKQYKLQNLVEVVRTAELYLKVDNQMDNSVEINIVNLVEKI